jgi:serine/threonine protein kinase/Tfp pilus assembly protein PilF
VPGLSLDLWREISPHLDDVLALPGSERARWVETLRKTEPNVADLLEQLLEEHALLARRRFLEAEPPRPAGDAYLAGQTLGPYRLVSPIGEGGMGAIWVAERNDGRFERRVAVKFLRFALAGPAAASRFEREGRILGQLAHPNIAELLDAGILAGGEPYLVLEYVDGEPIDRYCDRHSLSIDARIALFLDVLAAVAHAHAHLVIHRDIKPSNVLVAKDGQVKLLDFGVAKLLDCQGLPASPSMLTLEEGAGLTPEFASPEQLTGSLLTTATDVYSLGVLLYLLLTGRHPAGASRSAADLLKAIVQDEPPHLPDAIAANATRIAQERAATPEKLRRQLSGDLDTIVRKSLKKDPRERYASVSAFAADLRRFLQHEPVTVRPDTFAYRARKFVRRNRLAVGLAAVALLATIAGIVGTLLQARTARLQRDFALRQLSRAEAINDLNNYVLSNAAPSGKRFTVNDLLTGAEHIVERQQGSPATRAELLTSIGRQYTVQDQYQNARGLLEQAYTLSQKTSDPLTRARAACGLAQVLSRTGDPSRADALFHEGLAAIPAGPVFIVERVSCLLRGSEIASNAGNLRESLLRAELAQQELESSSFHSDALALDALIVLAGAYNHAGRRGDADRKFAAAAATLKTLGRDDTQMASTLFNNWGTMLIRAGRPLDAERALRRSIQVGSGGPGLDSVPPMTLVNYSYALCQLGRLGEATRYAEAAYRRARACGDVTATHQAGLRRARILRENGNLSEARDLLSSLEKEFRRSLPPGHIAFAVLSAEQALDARSSGELHTALKLIQNSINIAQNKYREQPGSADYFGRFLVLRSEIESRLGMTDQALRDASQALPILQNSGLPGRYSADVGHAWLALARALQARQQWREARAAFGSALANLQDAVGPDSPDVRIARIF